jgi:anti-sigma B factor antagonist
MSGTPPTLIVVRRGPVRSNIVKLTTREVYGAVIVDIEGQLVGGPNSGIFRRFVRNLLNKGMIRVIVNLRDVRWANSQGVGMLVGAQTRVKEAGGELVLVHVTDKIHSILTITRLHLFFTTFEREEEAIHYLRELEEPSKTVRSVS